MLPESLGSTRHIHDVEGRTEKGTGMVHAKTARSSILESPGTDILAWVKDGNKWKYTSDLLHARF